MNEKIKLEAGPGVFSWSPLPPRKKLDFTQKKPTEIIDDLPSPDPYLYPNCEFQIWLRSCEKEIEQPLKGVVTGLIPQWLNGSLIRNGPGSLKAGKDEFQHLFDSSALLHRFGIKDGAVTYQCKFLRSEIYKKIWTANRLVMTEFGTKALPDPCHTIFQKVATLFSFKSDMSDNAMISVYPFGDQVYAFNEIPFIHRIDIGNLDTLERVDLSENVSIVNHTSHPHVMEDSSVYNVGLTLYPTGPYYSVIHFPARKSAQEMFANGKIVASIPARWPLNPSYMHTFGITENYFVIVEQPFSVSLPSIVALKFKNEPLAGAFRWYGDQYTQINLISRQTGRLTHKFQAETCFYLHIINQYEDSDDHLVLDLCAYRDPSMLDCMYFETMRNMQNNPNYAKMFRGRPIRFVLPLKPSAPEDVADSGNLVHLEGAKASAKYLVNGDVLVKAERLADLGCETPRINYERFLGKKYRYFYAISSDVDSDNPGTLIKVDTLSKSSKTWRQKNCFPGEPVFVPSPESRFEDDGVILSVMVWGQEDTNRVGLLILDAESFEEVGRAEFRTPSAVPKCLHGWFFPEK